MKLLKSFQFALRGTKNAIKNEMNFRIHTVAALTVALFSHIFGVDGKEAAILTIIISLVFMAELINTAIEAMVDIISPQENQLAKIAKDSAAAAVLILALGAIIIAIFIFGDVERLKRVYDFIRENIFLVLFYIAICIVYIFACNRKTKERNTKL